MRETCPSLEARAKAEDAEIGGANETAAKPEAQVRRSSAPKGDPPVIRPPAQRFPSSILRSSKDRKRKLSLLVDHWRAHHARRVKESLQENMHRIEVHDLPSYSSELNPDEYLNNEPKQNLSRQGVRSSQSQLEDPVSGLMKLLKVVPRQSAPSFSQ